MMTLEDAPADLSAISVEVFNPEYPFGGVQVFGATEAPIQVEFNAIGIVRSVFGRIGDILPLQGDYDQFYAALNRGLPPGGTVGQTLAKSGNGDYAVEWSNAGAGSVTNFSAGNLLPLFTTDVDNSTSTPHLSFDLVNVLPHRFFGNGSDITDVPGFNTLQFDDINGRMPYSQLPQANNSRLLGRASTPAGLGDWEVISLGNGLEMNGSVLEANGLGTSLYTEMWTWTTKTTDANTAGQVGINNAAAASATVLNLNEKTTNNRDMTIAITELFTVGNEILFQKKTDSTKYARYLISGTPTDNGTWWSFPVTHLGSGAALPAGNDDTTVSLIVRGGVPGGVPSTTNLLAGNGSGGVSNSGIAPSAVCLKQTTYPTPTTINTVVSCLRAAGLCI